MVAAVEVMRPICVIVPIDLATQARQAGDRLRELVRTRDLNFSFVPCACRMGTEGTPDCNYGGAAARSRLAESMLAPYLLPSLAVHFVCGQHARPPTPRPWCKEMTHD